MSSGMLWAAIGGGARAGAQVLDDQAKREDEDRRHARSLEDRKSALLFEMKAKADFARQEEDAAADASSKIAERGAAIGNERGAVELEAARGTVPNAGEFANERITPEMIAAMPPQARAIYERDMGLTDDSPLQGMRDQVTASREIGAPASIRKGLLDSYKTELSDDQKVREADRKERQDKMRSDERNAMEEGRNNRLTTTLAAQAERTNAVIAGAMARSQSGGGGRSVRSEMTETLKYLDSSRKSLDSDARDLRAAMRAELENAQGRTAKAAIKADYEPRIMRVEAKRAAQDKQYESLGEKLFGGDTDSSDLTQAPTPKGAAKPPARDNQAQGKSATTTKAEYMALPKGARYTAPDGTTRIKG